MKEQLCAAAVRTINGFIRSNWEQTHHFFSSFRALSARFDGLLFSILLISWVLWSVPPVCFLSLIWSTQLHFTPLYLYSTRVREATAYTLSSDLASLSQYLNFDSTVQSKRDAQWYGRRSFWWMCWFHARDWLTHWVCLYRWVTNERKHQHEVSQWGGAPVAYGSRPWTATSPVRI